MNNIADVLNEIKTEEQLAADAVKKKEQGRKEALAKIEALTKQADAALAEAAQLAEEFTIEFYWNTPRDQSLTYKPESGDYDNYDDYYSNAGTGWTSSSDYC